MLLNSGAQCGYKRRLSNAHVQRPPKRFGARSGPGPGDGEATAMKSGEQLGTQVGSASRLAALGIPIHAHVDEIALAIDRGACCHFTVHLRQCHTAVGVCFDSAAACFSNVLTFLSTGRQLTRPTQVGK